jgi:hypothetical protein
MQQQKIFITPFVVECPHCHDFILIEEINCAIFRHAIFKNTGSPIPPHSTKQECEEWIRQDKVYGCAKPFRLTKERQPVPCDYI